MSAVSRAASTSAVSQGDVRERALKTFCLGLIVVQNSSLILVTSYACTREPAFLPSVAVWLAELLKFAAALLLLASEQGSFATARRRVASLIAEHSRDTLQFAIPAFCYTLQNFLWYFALSNLDPITAAVTSQMKVTTTAIASVLMLGRRLSTVQWVSLAILTLGMVVMQLPGKLPHKHQHGGEWSSSSRPLGRTFAAAGNIAGGGKIGTGGDASGGMGGGGGGGGSGGQPHVAPHNTIGGAAAMLLSTVLSAYAGVFLEKLFKTVQLTIWLQSIQLSLFALPISFSCMVCYDTRPVVMGTLFVGFGGGWAWVTVALSALGGIAVSVALKYADNILKTFAVGCSIVLNCAVSSFFLGVPLTLTVVSGVLLVVGSTFLFNAKELRAPAGALPEQRHGTALASSYPSSSAVGSSAADEIAPLRGCDDDEAHTHEGTAGAARNAPPLDELFSCDLHPYANHAHGSTQPLVRTEECVRRANSTSSPRPPQLIAATQPGASEVGAGTPLGLGGG